MIPPKPQQTPERDAYTRSRDMIAQAQNEAARAWRQNEILRATIRDLSDKEETHRHEAMRSGAQRDLVKLHLDRAEATLAAIRALHQPDPDTPTACMCGATHPCATRRALDKDTT